MYTEPLTILNLSTGAEGLMQRNGQVEKLPGNLETLPPVARSPGKWPLNESGKNEKRNKNEYDKRILRTKPFNSCTLTGKLKVKYIIEYIILQKLLHYYILLYYYKLLYYKNIIMKNMKRKTNVITFLFR